MQQERATAAERQSKHRQGVSKTLKMILAELRQLRAELHDKERSL